MATTTPRIGLTKPDGTDLVDIAVLNTNFDKIDSNIASTKIQSTKPTTANAGDLWWDSDTGTLYLYYTDANSSQWVAATSDPINIGVVASQAERDAQYPTPAQGMSVYRTDLGVTQRYYGLFNSSTNPGGRDTAGWYDTEKSIGLVPVRPGTVTYTDGSSTTTSLGKITFSGITSMGLNDVFTDRFANYKIKLIIAHSTASSAIFRITKNGTQSTAGYGTNGIYTSGGGSGITNATYDRYYIYPGSVDRSFNDIEIYGPKITGYTGAFHTHIGTSGTGSAQNIEVYGMTHYVSDSYDGVYFISGAGTMTGSIQIFGYNEK